jgi:hypothetical protein
VLIVPLRVAHSSPSKTVATGCLIVSLGSCA